jgi:hypothetical protein
MHGNVNTGGIMEMLPVGQKYHAADFAMIEPSSLGSKIPFSGCSFAQEAALKAINHNEEGAYQQ